MTRVKELWQKLISSRILAGFGIVAILTMGVSVISSLAQAQNVTYMPASVSDINSLQQQINALNNRLIALEARLAGLEPAPPSVHVTTTTAYPTTQPAIPNTGTGEGVTYGPAVIDQNGGTYVAGFDIYFTGRGFAPYEQVLIMRNGVNVGHVNADAGGNISSSGVLLPLGTSTFTFAGQSSGVSVVANVNGASSVTPGSI